MKHFFSFLFSMQRMRKALVAFVLLSTSLVSWANVSLVGVDYTVDTLRQMVVGPGSEYLQMHMTRASDGKSPLDVFIFRVDTKNPHIRFEQVLSYDRVIGTERPTAMMARKSTPTSVYVGGVNGDFFATTGDIGTPIGLTIGNSEFAYIGHPHYKVGTIKDDGRPEISNSNWWAADPQVTWVYAGKLVVGQDTFPIHHVNSYRLENELVLYNHYQGASTATNNYGSEAVLSLLPNEKWTTSGKMKAVVEDVAPNTGNTTLAANKFVLSGHGTMKSVIESLKIADEVEIIYSLLMNGREVQVAQCVSGHQSNLMVNNGEVVTENFWDELHPRTGYGYSQTGDTVIFCVVDGRNSAQSVGCNTQVLGAIMRHYGAWYALNWDGGGSSCLAINHFGQMNNGSDGSERAVANAMFAIADVPEDDQTIATLRPYETTMLLPHYGYYAPKFLGYNKYDVLINNDVQGVQLSCDASLGEILTDGGLLASGGVNGLLHATLGGVSTDINIRFEVGSQVSFRFDSVLVDNFKPYTVEVQSLVDGNLITLPAHVLTWTVEDESICTVSPEGVITGVANGVTTVAGQLGAFADTLTVYVQIPTVRNLLWDDFRTPENWKVKGASGYSPKLVVPDAATEPVDLQFTYKANRNPYVQLSRETAFYGLPDSVSIAYTTDALIDNVQFFIQLNNATAATNRTFTDLPTSGKVSLSCSFGDWVDATDRNCWPVKMRYVKFNFNPETPAGAHHIYLYGITLHYTSIDIVTQLGNAAGPSWHVYPNPVVDNMLQIQDITSGSQLVLTDLQGRQLIQQTLTDAHAELDMAAYPAGQYLLTIDNQTITIIKK